MYIYDSQGKMTRKKRETFTLTPVNLGPGTDPRGRLSFLTIEGVNSQCIGVDSSTNNSAISVPCNQGDPAQQFSITNNGILQNIATGACLTDTPGSLAGLSVKFGSCIDPSKPNFNNKIVNGISLLYSPTNDKCLYNQNGLMIYDNCLTPTNGITYTLNNTAPQGSYLRNCLGCYKDVNSLRCAKCFAPDVSSVANNLTLDLTNCPPGGDITVNNGQFQCLAPVAQSVAQPVVQPVVQPVAQPVVKNSLGFNETLPYSQYLTSTNTKYVFGFVGTTNVTLQVQKINYMSTSNLRTIIWDSGFKHTLLGYSVPRNYEQSKLLLENLKRPLSLIYLNSDRAGFYVGVPNIIWPGYSSDGWFTRTKGPFTVPTSADLPSLRLTLQDNGSLVLADRNNKPYFTSPPDPSP